MFSGSVEALMMRVPRQSRVLRIGFSSIGIPPDFMKQEALIHCEVEDLLEDLLNSLVRISRMKGNIPLISWFVNFHFDFEGSGYRHATYSVQYVWGWRNIYFPHVACINFHNWYPVLYIFRKLRTIEIHAVQPKRIAISYHDVLTFGGSPTIDTCNVLIPAQAKMWYQECLTINKLNKQ